ncbi:hypothetical protein PIB30_040048 [Stylosanthes scabra]|uniref:Uncharacterized protein n=1 Tax=Stylosanthes scabra TaxID=79078 RepID=A0ABU6TE50_9FABA|nr:hypothetical protein [Stylosanthes scabra]
MLNRFEQDLAATMKKGGPNGTNVVHFQQPRDLGGDAGQGECDWYDFLNEILELKYLGESKNRVVLFRCKSYDPARPRGMCTHKDYRITEINHNEVVLDEAYQNLEEIPVRLITETEILETHSSPAGEVDIVNTQGSAQEEEHRKRTGVPLDLEPVDPPSTQATATPPPHVIPTPSLSVCLLTMRMIPTPISRFSHLIHRGLGGTLRPPHLVLHSRRSMIMTMMHCPLQARPYSLPPIDNPFPQGEEDDTEADEATAARDGCVYLRWDGEPPLIDDEAISTQIADDPKKGRIYGKDIVLAYSVPLIIGDVDDDDIATGPPDVRE